MQTFLGYNISYYQYLETALAMRKILISVPGQLAARMKATLPARQRSKIIAHLIEQEIKKREKALYECALAVENDKALNHEMKEWDETSGDGLSNEPW
jgi:hypothetical protein